MLSRTLLRVARYCGTPFMFAALLAAAAPVAIPSPIRAADCDEDIRFESTLQAVDLTLRRFTVDGQLYATDHDTEFEDANSNPISLEDFIIGEAVRVRYCPDSGTPPIATHLTKRSGGATFTPAPTVTPAGTPGATVTPTSTPGTTVTPTSTPGGTTTPTPSGTPNNDCDQEIESFISAIDSTGRTMVIGGVLVRTDSRTFYEDRDDNPLTFESFFVGDKAEAEGCFQGDGSLLAKKIDLKQRGNNVTPTITPQPTITPTPDPSSTSTPAPTVTPTATSGSNDCGNEVEQIVGSRNDSARTYFIGGVLVRTDSRTRFEDRDDNVLQFGDINPGDEAEGEGCFLADGSLLAKKVERKTRNTGPTPTVTPTPDPSATSTPAPTVTQTPAPTGTPGDGGNNCGHEVESFIGVIDSGAMTMVIGGVLVRTDSRTRYEDRDDNVLVFGDFLLGDKAEAEGCFQADGAILAKKIELKQRGGVAPTFTPNPTPDPSATATPEPTMTAVPTPGNDLTIFGLIGQINLVVSSITVDGVTFIINENTRIEDRRSNTLTIEDLRIQMRVRAEGDSLGDGTFLAREINVQEENITPGAGASQNIVGTSTALFLPDGMIVGNTVVDLSGSPVVRNFDGQLVGINNIGVGDLLKVEGTPQGNGSLLARSIEVRASMLSAVNNEQMRFTASNTEVQITGATELKDTTGAPLPFGGFVTGDLIKVEGSFAGGMVNAREIRLVHPLMFSPRLGEFVNVVPELSGGVASIRSTENTNTFGFIELPDRSFATVPNTLYEITARIRTDLSDRSMAPVARVRANMQTFQKGLEFVITSEQDGRFAPTLEGKEYKAYFVPSLPSSGSEAPDWFASLDLLNVNPFDAAEGTLFLESISATPVDFSRVNIVETLYQESFSTSAHGWTSGGAPGVYSLPQTNWNREAGALEITPTDNNTFGFWEKNLGVNLLPNTLYRARFLVRSQYEESPVIPTVRGRLNLTSFQLAAVTVIESTAGGDESPSTQSRIYDVYLYIPGTPVSGESVLASFDLLNNLAENETGKPVYLEHVTFERLAITP